MKFSTDIVTGAATQRFLAKSILYEGDVITQREFLGRMKQEGWTVKIALQLPKSWGRKPLGGFEGTFIDYSIELIPETVYKAVKPNSHEELTITKTEYFVFQSL